MEDNTSPCYSNIFISMKCVFVKAKYHQPILKIMKMRIHNNSIKKKIGEQKYIKGHID